MLSNLGPGVVVDETGALHLYLDEMLAAAGYADTPENRQTLIDEARKVFGGRMSIADEVDGATP